MAYTKPLRTISVTIHGSDTPVEVSDAVDSPAASLALRAYSGGKAIVLPVDGGELHVPYHAIVAIAVSVTDSDPITPASPC